MVPTRHILILGAGELGTAIINALLNHPAYDATTTSITLVVRPETLASLPAVITVPVEVDTGSKTAYLSSIRSRGVHLISADLVADSLDTLTVLFEPYTTVIHAGAMSLPPGTQLKVTHAAIAAGVDEYVPWQWGVDYDLIGRSGGMGLFAEQNEVRGLLRSQTNEKKTKWWIVSCGVFMSFLFEEFWGVVMRHSDGKVNGVRALGGWDHELTVTTAEDIARCNAELVLVDTDIRDRVVFIAGESMQYDQFADLVEQIVGRKLKRELWTTEWLRKQAEKDERNKLWKYRVVFSEGVGLSWAKEKAYNHVKGIEMEGVEGWMKRIGLS
ncbi:hypothetical protein H2198_000593 [Neophaeococcomyces mojaviensis]|uniref:Uncharacterized protein n=1 Tax=Neophaeococcomyces mojaviensis TaxID=3383035 RepID=A0ACC3AJD6_9EURO|nr:hypothetical protein H2198_000593 [Knufia sp. JES_112]